MPSYIQKRTPLTAVTADHTMVISGEATSEEAWEAIKLKFPTFSGARHSEEHVKYSRQFLETIAINNQRIDNDEAEIFNKVAEIGIWLYIENCIHDEVTRIVSWDIVEYFRDQTALTTAETWLKSSNVFNNHAERANPSIYTTVDFHRPYREPEG